MTAGEPTSALGAADANSSVHLPSKWRNAAGRAYPVDHAGAFAGEVVDRHRIPIRRKRERIDHERVVRTVGCVPIWIVVAALREVGRPEIQPRADSDSAPPACADSAAWSIPARPPRL